MAMRDLSPELARADLTSPVVAISPAVSLIVARADLVSPELASLQYVQI